LCTAITLKTQDFYFGRTLDYDFSYSEEVCIVPRNFPLSFKTGNTIKSHFAIIGTAYVMENYPLYYDAANEKGLCMAGLNFVGNAHYSKQKKDKNNVAQFELVPFVLSQCESVCEAKTLLKKTNITDTPFSDGLPTAELHWIISDKNESITVEAVKEGLKIYDNRVGVLTNNPPFDTQLFSLNNFSHLSARDTENTFSSNLKLNKYSRGLGLMGLPGDYSSQSRFIRASFLKENSLCEKNEEQSVNQFFRILGSVNNVRGSCILENGNAEITIYTSCINADKGIYYYTTYDNMQITAVDISKENLNSQKLIRYPFVLESKINFIN